MIFLKLSYHQICQLVFLFRNYKILNLQCFFSNIFAFLFSVFWKYKLYNFCFVWEEGFEQGTELYNSFLPDFVSPEKDPMKQDEMWSDDQLSSSLRRTVWHSRWTCRTWWKKKLWTQKKWTDVGWLNWKGMLKQICRNLAAVMSDKRSGGWYCRCCCCIREVVEECKRMSWPSSAVEEEEVEEIWAPHDYSSMDEVEDMLENFDSW